MQFKIPPRSPDINPIEIFVAQTLKTQAIEENIKKQTLNEFTSRVIDTMLNYPA